MKEVLINQLLDNGHSLMNDVVMDTARILKDAYLIV